MIKALYWCFSILEKIVCNVFTLSYNLGKNIVAAVSFLHHVLSYACENIYILLRIVLIDFGYFLKDFTHQLWLVLQFITSCVEAGINAIVTKFEIILVIYEKVASMIKFSFDAVTNFFTKIFELYTEIFEGVKALFVLFGSGVWFLITIIPLTIVYINVTITYYVGRVIQEVWTIIYNAFAKVFLLATDLCNVFHDVPVEATLGLIVFLGVCIMIGKFNLNMYIRARNIIGAMSENARFKWNMIKGNYFSRKNRRPQLIQVNYEDNINCVICQDNPKCILILPCKHLCLCIKCRDALPRHQKRCPICRTNISQTMKVFV